MDKCLQDLNCRKVLSSTYGSRLTTAVNNWYPDLLKKIDSIQNLTINSEHKNFYFSAAAVDMLEKSVVPESKVSIILLNEFPFYYFFSGESESQGRYVNMNCFFINHDQYNNLSKLISSEYFNVYDQKREVLVQYTSKVCKSKFFKKICRDEINTRKDTIIDKVFCYKQTNEVYDAFVEIAKMDLMKENGGKPVQNLLQELPAEGTTLLNSCMPNCQICSSFDECNQCEQQYCKMSNKCMRCHPSCLTCSQQNQEGCLTCQPNLLLYKNQCIKQCPQGFLNLNGICKPCTVGCQVCKSLTDNCIECNYGLLLLKNNKCQNMCNNGFYFDVNTLKCKNCQEGCIDCINEEYCNKCAQRYQKYGDKCTLECSYNFISINGICTKCSHKCEDCIEDNENCLKCSEGYYMFNGDCEIYCKDGYFQDEDKRICEKCHENCSKCRGPKSIDCLTCSTNAQEQNYSIQCLYSQTQDCEICGVESVCQKCKDPKVLKVNLDGSYSCLDFSPVEQYQYIVIIFCVIIFTLIIGTIQLHKRLKKNQNFFIGLSELKKKKQNYNSIPNLSQNENQVSLSTDLDKLIEELNTFQKNIN